MPRSDRLHMFQPFLRFYWGMSSRTPTELEVFVFQPFLRFYMEFYHAYECPVTELIVSTLLEILRRQPTTLLPPDICQGFNPS